MNNKWITYKGSGFLIFFVFTSFCVIDVSTQVHKSKKLKSGRSAITIYEKKTGLSNRNTKPQKTYDFTEQAEFRSPFRYIIFSNLTDEDLDLDIPQRRLEVLMDAKAYRLKNLKLLFSLIANRFQSPVRLEITVHTSLATIETPEELEMMSDHTSRENSMITIKQLHMTGLTMVLKRLFIGTESHQGFGKK